MDNTCVIRVDEVSGFNTMFDYLFSDIGKSYPYEIVREKRGFTRFHHKVLNSAKFIKLTGGRFNYCLSNAYELSEVLKKQCAHYKRVIVLFTNNCFIHTSFSYEALAKLKKKYDKSIWVLFYLDQIDKAQCRNANQLRHCGLFDLIYTYDHRDAKKHGFIEWNTPYSVTINEKVQVNKKKLYFCGTNTKLFSLVSEIAESCEKEKVLYSMDIVSCPEDCELLKPHESICIKNPQNGFFDYDYLLHESLSSNCILELVQDGFGLTIRPYEATCYNKKLLTNNKNIFDFSYYNPIYIQYFDRVENIDWGWVKEESMIDYNYRGEFSPIYLIKDIQNRIKSTESA